MNSSDVAVSVAIRVRPLNKRENGQGDHSGAWEIQGNSLGTVSEWMSDEDQSKPVSIPPTSFSFDHIFGPSVRTNTVYNRFASEVVETAMNGMNGTIFAYGQTSSGKTHTILGNDSEPGLIPMAIDHIFNIILETPESEYLLRVSYLEIYNEIIRDLLEPSNTHLKIHETMNREVFVGNLTEKVVTSPEDVHQLLALGQGNRHVGETNLNEKSSRSHTLFRMVIESRERGTASGNTRGSVGGGGGAIRVSHLNLVDLAGSERAGQTGAEGIRLKEGGHINKSLLSLATVIAKLSEGGDSSNKHIPYRDSKLTRILQNSLGGNAKTAIICNITPSYLHLDETNSTLRFASRAKKIVNKPHVNQVVSDETLLKRYRKEISELKKQLDQYREADSEMIEKQQSLIVSESTTPSSPEKDPVEMARVAEKLEELKKMILDSSHVHLQTESSRLKSLKKIRRRTWYPGADITSWDEPETPIAEVKPSPKRRKKDSLPPYEEAPESEIINTDELSPSELLAKIDKRLPDVDAGLANLIQAVVIRYKDTMTGIDAVRMHFQDEREFERLEYQTSKESSEKTIASLREELHQTKLDSAVSTLTSSVLSTAWTEVAHETKEDQLTSQYQTLYKTHQALEKELELQVSKHKDELSRVTAQFKEACVDLERHVAETRSLKETYENSTKGLAEQILQSNTMNEHLTSQIKDLESYKESILPQMQALEAERDEKAFLLEQSHAKVDELSKALAAERDESLERLGKLTSELEKKEALSQIQTSSSEEMNAKNQEWASKMQVMEQTLNEQIENLQQQLDERNNRLNTFQQEMSELKSLSEHQERELVMAHEKLQKAEEIARADQQQLDEFKSLFEQEKEEFLKQSQELAVQVEQIIGEKDQELNDARETLTKLEAAIEVATAEIVQWDEKYAVLEKEKNELLLQIQQRDLSSNEDVAAKEQELQILQEQLTELKTSATTDQLRIRQLEELNCLNEQEKENLVNEEIKMSERIEELLGEKNSLQKELDHLRDLEDDRNRIFTNKEEHLKQQLLEMTTERDRVAEHISVARSTIATMEEQIATITMTLELERENAKISIDKSRQGLQEELEEMKASQTNILQEKEALVLQLEASQQSNQENLNAVQVLQSQYADVQIKLCASSEVQKQLEEALTLATKTITDYQDIEKERDLAVNKQQDLISQAQSLADKLQSTQNQVLTLQEQQSQVQSAYESQVSTLEAMQQQLDLRNEEREKGMTMLNQYAQQVASLERAIAERDEENEALFDKLKQSLQRTQSLETQLVEHERDREKQIGQADVLTGQINELEAQLLSCQKEIEVRLKSYQDLEKQKNVLMDEFEKTSRAVQFHQKEASRARKEVDELRLHIAQLERKLSTSQNSDQENNPGHQVSTSINNHTSVSGKVLADSTKPNTAEPTATGVPKHVRTSRLPPGASGTMSESRAGSASGEVKLTKRVSRLKQQAMKNSDNDEGCNQQ